MVERKTRYRISEISLDQDGIFWLFYIGDVPDQGGLHFGFGEVGFYSYEDAINYQKGIIEKHLPEYKKIIDGKIKKEAEEKEVPVKKTRGRPKKVKA